MVRRLTSSTCCYGQCRSDVSQTGHCVGEFRWADNCGRVGQRRAQCLLTMAVDALAMEGSGIGIGAGGGEEAVAGALTLGLLTLLCT